MKTENITINIVQATGPQQNLYSYHFKDFFATIEDNHLAYRLISIFTDLRTIPDESAICNKLSLLYQTAIV